MSGEIVVEVTVFVELEVFATDYKERFGKRGKK